VNALLKIFLIAALATACAPAVFADQPKTDQAKAEPAKPALPRSVFVMPTNAREGRDPFYPESARPYEDNPASKHTITENSFTVKGLSVEGGHPMVIINNHTFAIGDEGDVLTTSGRVHIHLTEIRPTAVVIEVNGLRRELPIGLK
jgi:hypothetical protein